MKKMENKFKRFLSLALVLFMLISMIPVNTLASDVATAAESTASVLYLKPGVWTSDNARFAAYFFNNATGKNEWVSMTQVDNNYYCVQVPTTHTYPNVIFVRMNPSTTSNNWNNVWNQTVDLKVTASSCYTITDPWGNDSNGKKATGNWSSLTSRTLYAVMPNGWSKINAYTWNKADNIHSTDWSGTAMTKVEGEENIWAIEVLSYYDYIIFNNGADQTSDLKIPTNGNDQYDITNKKWSVFVPTEPVADIDGVKYTTLAKATAAAKEGDTIKLLIDYVCPDETTYVNADTTLDLNGHMLTVNGLMAYGDVIDGEVGGNGGLILNSEAENARIMLLENNAFLPLYDATNGCYRFFEYEMASRGARNGHLPNSSKFGFTLYFTNKDAYLLLADAANSGVELALDVSWESKPDDLVVEFVFSEELMKKFALAAYEQLADGTVEKTTKVLTLTVSGMDALGAGEAVTVTPTLKSESTGVATVGDPVSYALVPSAEE